MNIKQITKLIAKDMEDINIIIHKKLNSTNIELINQLCNYIVNGGKRIRPMIVVLIARALNYQKKQHVIIGALIEFIHAATLLHDDVVDRSDMRRGRATANLIFGNSASILVGDFIYTRAFQIMTELSSVRILSLMSEAVNIIAEGEILQLINCNNPNVSIDNYMKIINCKTARLFEVASQSSAILAGADNVQEIALRNYGRYLGIAFQLIDDISDYYNEDKIFGKSLGDDLNEGKLTLPLLHAINNCSPIQASFIRKVIRDGNGRQSLNNILEVMYQCGSLEYVKNCASLEVNKAVNCLDCLSPSPYRYALESLANLIINRNF